MKKLRKLIVHALRAIMFLVSIPITLLCLGIFFSIALLIVRGYYLSEHAVLLFSVVTSGYGLFSFLWLLGRFERLSTSEIPNSIKLGLFSGSVASITYFISIKEEYLNGAPGIIFIDFSIISMLTFVFVLLIFMITWPANKS